MSTILGTRETIHVANYFNASPQELSFLGPSLGCLQLSLPQAGDHQPPWPSRERATGTASTRYLDRTASSRCQKKTQPILLRRGSWMRRRLWRLCSMKWAVKPMDMFWPLCFLLTSLFPAGNLVSVWPAVWKTRVGFPLIWWVFWHSKHKKNNTRK